MKVVVLGPPGSGKEFQALMIAKKYGIEYITEDDRETVYSEGDGFVLKGYPNTEDEADEFIKRTSPDICFYLRIGAELSRERLENRGDSHDIIKDRVSSFYDSSDFEMNVVRKFPNVIELDGSRSKEQVTNEIFEHITSFFEGGKVLLSQAPRREKSLLFQVVFSWYTCILVVLVPYYFFYFPTKRLFLLSNSYIVVSVLIYCVSKILQKVYKYCTRKGFKNQVVLITGGANGLGKVLAERFLLEESVVIIWDVDEKGGRRTVQEFKKKYKDCPVFFHMVDITQTKQVKDHAEEISKEFGGVDVLVNNAGIVSKRTVFSSSERMIRKTMEVNTLSHFWTVREFVPRMIERNSGHIVTVASSAALAGVAGLQVYCASKFAAYGFNESLRLQFRRDGVSGVDTLVVMPYYMKGPMFQGARSPIVPLLDMEDVADKIMVGMKEREAELVIP